MLLDNKGALVNTESDQKLTRLLLLAVTVCFGFSCFAAQAASVCQRYKGDELQLSGIKLERLSSIKPVYNGFNIFEGPVWLNGALYFTNIGTVTEGDKKISNQGVIRRLTSDGKESIWLGDDQAGFNGLAIDQNGDLVAGRQMDGSVSRISIKDKSLTPIAAQYEDKRFNSPNDLVVAKNGDIYFTDANWNTPSNIDAGLTQGGGKPGSLDPGQRVYKINSDGVVRALSVTEQVKELRDKPNGITLSLDEKQLIVGGLQGLWVFDLDAAGVSNPKKIQPQLVDGLARDCGGNIYVATKRTNSNGGEMHGVAIYNKQWKEVGFIRLQGAMMVTNVAFGGDDGKTLFITTLGSAADKNKPAECDGAPCQPASLYQVELNIPGLPY